MTNSREWQPSAPLANLRKRARILAEIRAFFVAREVLEVETPILSAAGNTDPQIESFVTRYAGPEVAAGMNYYLHTSPEFPMKRLLAAGSGSIYQICKVFRQGEAGRYHNPEFTLLEWYRIGFDHHDLMTEMTELVEQILAEDISLDTCERLTYAEVFRRYADVDPHAASEEALAACAQQHGIEVEGLGDMARDAWLDLLMSMVVQPQLGQGRLCFIYDYPASQAALARIRPGQPPLAERFELYLNGIELANGFHELADSDEQQRRFHTEQEKRRTAGQQDIPPDDCLVAALAQGFPDCAGVALGIDRLVMLACGAANIAEVVAFPIDRA